MPTRKYVRHNLRTDEDVEEYSRITLPLSEDILEALDAMAQAGGYRGKGRTVAALVEAVMDSREYVIGFLKSGITNTLVQASPLGTPVERQQHAQQLAVNQLINGAVVVDRLRKFLGVDPNEIAEQVKKEIDAQVKAQAANTTSRTSSVGSSG